MFGGIDTTILSVLSRRKGRGSPALQDLLARDCVARRADAVPVGTFLTQHGSIVETIAPAA
jgi:hypothetical protein